MRPASAAIANVIACVVSSTWLSDTAATSSTRSGNGDTGTAGVIDGGSGTVGTCTPVAGDGAPARVTASGARSPGKYHSTNAAAAATTMPSASPTPRRAGRTAIAASTR